MYPIIGKHTEENMSLTIERKEKDTISQETNCNITSFIQLNPRFDQNSIRDAPVQTRWKAQRYG